MFAILQEINVENQSIFSILFNKTINIELGITKVSFKATNLSLLIFFNFEEHEELKVEIDNEIIQHKLDISESVISFNFKKTKVSLKFNFLETKNNSDSISSNWSLLDPDIQKIGLYKNEKYFINNETLESSFKSQFNLSKSFPSFSLVERNDKKLYVDHLNNFVISSSPAIRQNTVKSKIKTNFYDSLSLVLPYESLCIKIDRQNLIKTSHSELLNFLKAATVKDLIVCFDNEMGEDHGAIRREYFYLLVNLLVNDERIVNNNHILDVNQDFNCSEFFFEYQTPAEIFNILDDLVNEPFTDTRIFFVLLGVAIGALLVLGETINANFSFIFYENLLSRDFTLRHIQDPEIQKSLSTLPEDEIDEVILERFFNPKKNQYDHIRFGFKIVASEMSKFSAFDFPFIFYHFEEISIEKLKRMIKYNKCTAETKEIAWLWKALETKDQPFLSRFLLFISGSGCLPRFEEETFLIFDKTNYLNEPFTASVCNRMLYVPTFENYEKLLYFLDLSVLNTEGFHFV